MARLLRWYTRMRFIGIALLLPMTACSAPTVISSTSAPDAVLSPVCVIDVKAPERFTDTLWRNDRRDTDCTQTVWVGALEVGFSHDEWKFHVAIPRALNAPGRLDLDAGTVALWFFDRDGACVDWTGSLTWQDVPQWGLSIEAACATNPLKRLVGTWSGNRG